MTNPAPTEEVFEPTNSETGERTREANLALNVVSSLVIKWLTATTLASTEGSQTAWDMARKMYAATGGTTDDMARAGKAISEFCTGSFKTSRLVDTDSIAGSKGRSIYSHTLSPDTGAMAAAVAGVLIKCQLDHPDVDVTLLFGNAERRNKSKETPLDVLRLINTRSRGEYVPVSFIWSEASSHGYFTADALADVGILDRISKHDPNVREFVIEDPESNSKRGGDVAKMARAASIELLRDGETRVTGTKLMDKIMSLFPDADEEKTWRELAHRQPHFLRSVLPAALSRGYDKVAMRINPHYQAMVDQLLDDFDLLIRDVGMQEAAIKYGVEVLKSPEAMALLLEMAYPPALEARSNIPAPDYEGWHAELHRPEPWRPQFPTLQKAQVDLADVALRDPQPDASGRMPLTNKLLSEMIERAAQARHGKTAS